LPTLLRAVAQAEGRLQAVQARAAGAAAAQARANSRQALSERGQVVLQQAARLTQEQLQYQVSDLVTAALQAVFPRPYEFRLTFAEQRGRTEARAELLRGGVESDDPMGATGGGVVDVVAFALRVAMWSLAPAARRPRPLLVLDEPFRFLSADLRERAASLLHELCERLGLQIVMVTHEPAFVIAADTTHKLAIRSDGVSRLESSERAG